MKIPDILKKHTPVPTAELMEARLLLHHAAQVIPSVARAHLEHQPDDSHTNMGWAGDLNAFMGHAITAGDAVLQIGLQVDHPALLIHQHGRGPIQHLPLAGITLAAAQAWLQEQLAAAGFIAGKIDWQPGYDLPPHAVTGGAALDFSGLQAATESLAAWFANGFAVIAAAAAEQGADAPRCWPHHFDVGTLIFFGKNGAGEEQSIGVGLSPGDENYATPYYYVSPWPGGDVSTLPTLHNGGRWHTKGFVSAVLNAETLHDSGDQARQVHTYLEESIAAAKSRLVLNQEGTM